MTPFFTGRSKGEVNEKAALSVPDSDAVEELTNEQKKAREEDNGACHQVCRICISRYALY